MRVVRAAAAAAVVTAALPVAVTGQTTSFAGLGVTRGDSTAPIAVVEFGDFGCSACALFARESFPTIDEDFVQSGRVRWRFIPFVLGPFRHAKEAAIASLCANEQEAFWQMHDVLYESQDAWKRAGDPASSFGALAEELGLDRPTFERCYRSDEASETVKAFSRLARKEGIRATPTFIIGEHRVLGALPAQDFARLLEHLLSEKARAGTR